MLNRESDFSEDHSRRAELGGRCALGSPLIQAIVVVTRLSSIRHRESLEAQESLSSSLHLLRRQEQFAGLRAGMSVPDCSTRYPSYVKSLRLPICRRLKPSPPAAHRRRAICCSA